ncbi:MAG: hypothetical protein AABO41_13515 [Acidobacteriota bacterium]
MLPTYRAKLRGDHLEWEDEVPEQTGNQQPLDVFVTIMSDSVSGGESRGRRMARALEGLAKKGGVSNIEDASDWQRDQRKERPLPEAPSDATR